MQSLPNVLNASTLTVNPNEITNLNSYEPNVFYFEGINHQNIQSIEEIAHLDRSKCVLFDDYFVQSFDASHYRNKKICEIINELWKETVNRCVNFANQIESEHIELSELDSKLSTFFSNNFTDSMRHELIYLMDYFKLNNSTVRLNQIDKWHKFKTLYDTTKEIDKIRKTLEMTDSFNELNLMRDQSFQIDYNEWQLNAMNSEAKQSQHAEQRWMPLEEIYTKNQDTLVCLKSFADSLLLVKWLKKQIVNLNQFAILVDRLSLSNERTMQARSLRDTVNAYAPLVFDLNANDSFGQFMLLCQKVFRNGLAKDELIGKKLKGFNTPEDIEMLTDVLAKTGSGELEKVKQINLNGVYVINESVADFVKLDLLKNSSDDAVKYFV